MPIGLRRATALLPVITAVIVTAGLFAPAEARSECGSYVVYTDPAHGKPTEDHSPDPVKCQGPNCSQAPAPAPMPQAPPHLRILSDQSLPLVASIGSSCGESATRPFDRSGGAPVHRPSDVFHPPR